MSLDINVLRAVSGDVKDEFTDLAAAPDRFKDHIKRRLDAQRQEEENRAADVVVALFQKSAIKKREAVGVIRQNRQVINQQFSLIERIEAAEKIGNETNNFLVLAWVVGEYSPFGDELEKFNKLMKEKLKPKKTKA